MTERINSVASLMMGLASDMELWEREQQSNGDTLRNREAEVVHRTNCLNLMSDTLKTREIGVTDREKAVKTREDNMQDQTRVASNRLAIIKNLEVEIKDLKACRDKQRIAEAALRQCLGEKADLLEQNLALSAQMLECLVLLLRLNELYNLLVQCGWQPKG